MALEPNTYAATHRFARISARKARIVMDVIRGDPVESALVKLKFSHRRASPMIRKVLRSALANATQKAGLSEEQLVVWRAFVDGGPIMKRIKPRAQGRAYPRLRRTCHLSIILKEIGAKEAAKKLRGKAAEPSSGGAATGGAVTGTGGTVGQQPE